jgi:aryl-alcohol dehydrogenase-like predicted oxidoreductase
VFPVCFGGNVFGWTLDRNQSFDVLDAYVHAGGNFIDTANTYSKWHPGNQGGESEEIIGAWLRQSGRRDEMVIATKLGGEMGGRKGLAPEDLMAAVDASLGRLGLDHVDLLYAHYDDPATPPAETLSAFDELVRAGKVRAIGASNFTAGRLEESLATSRELGVVAYSALQPKYSLVERDFESELEPVCREHGISVMPYLALANGFLTGKYRRGRVPPDTPRAAEVEADYANDTRAWATLDALDAVAARLDATVAQVAVAWLIGRPVVTAAIASATSRAQVEELCGSTEVALGRSDREALDRGSAA